MILDRNKALQLLSDWLTGPSLLEHSLAVEQAMRKYAEYYGEDVEKWGLVGLLHDMDFENNPDPNEHGLKTADILRSMGYDQQIIDAILGHNPVLGFPRTTKMAKCLLACDELTGLIVASAKVLPNKMIDQLKVESVLKKFKSPSFAKNVDRTEIQMGIDEIGVDFKEHVSFLINALTEVASSIGLNNSK